MIAFNSSEHVAFPFPRYRDARHTMLEMYNKPIRRRNARSSDHAVSNAINSRDMAQSHEAVEKSPSLWTVETNHLQWYSSSALKACQQVIDILQDSKTYLSRNLPNASW